VRGLAVSGIGLAGILTGVGTVLAGLAPLLIDGTFAWQAYKASVA
jgi:hypothetical protein